MAVIIWHDRKHMLLVHNLCTTLDHVPGAKQHHIEPAHICDLSNSGPELQNSTTLHPSIITGLVRAGRTSLLLHVRTIRIDEYPVSVYHIVHREIPWINLAPSYLYMSSKIQNSIRHMRSLCYITATMSTTG